MSDLSQHWRRFCADLGEPSFLPIYQATERLVWTICWRVLRDEADARDAFQSTYTRLLAAARSRETDDPVALARRFASLEAQALAKRRARLSRREAATVDEYFEASESTSASERLGAEQLRALLVREADRLEDDLRLPVELHFFDGMTQREVAESLGVSVSTVNDRLKRAFDRLRGPLRRAGIQRPEDALPMLLPLAMLLAPPSDLSAAGVFAEARVASAAAGLAPKGSMLAGAAGKVAVALLVVASALLSVGVLVANRPTKAALTPAPSLATITPATASQAKASDAASLPMAAPVAPVPVIPTPTLAPAGSLSMGGVLVDELTGAPIGDVTIRLGLMVIRGGENAAFENQTPVASTLTSPAGEFDFDGLAQGDYQLFVDSDRYRLVDDDFSNFERVDLREGSKRNLQLAAFPGNQVSGVVLDAITSEPLTGVRVASRNRSLQRVRQQFGVADAPEDEAVAITGTDGRYVLNGVFGERFTSGGSGGDTMRPFRGSTLVFGKPGYSSQHYKYPRDWAVPYAPVWLTKSVAAQPRDLLLIPVVSCELSLLSVDGVPIKGASVKIASPPPISEPSPQSWTSDGNGRVTIAVPFGIPVGLAAHAPAFIDGGAEVKLKSENTGAPLVVRLRSLGGRHLRFRIQDESGKAISDHRSFWLQGTPARGTTKYIVQVDLPIQPDGILEVATFDPSMVEGGRLFLTAGRDDRFLPLEYRIPPGDMTAKEPVPITLIARSKGRGIEGTITNGSQGPVEGATVFAPGDPYAVKTDAAGRFRISIPPDATSLVIRHPDLGVTAIRELRECENDLDWSRANAIAEVRVFDANTRQPIKWLQAAMDEAWSQHLVRDPNREHVFVVEQGIGAGRIKFQIMDPHHASQEVDLEIPAGKTLFAAPIEVPALGLPRAAAWAKFEPGT